MRLLAGLALALLLSGAPRTVDELWTGFDPRALPLESEVAQEWKRDNLTIRRIYYTSEISSGHKVRVIGYYGFPAQPGKMPGILHIHGGGQTATREYVEYWAKRGYAALSINWGGYPLEQDPAQGNTDWGPIRAAQRDTTNTYRVTPDARVNSWYHWAIACRRGLTFLEQQMEVDPSRLGIFGVSMGGRLTWLVAGLDRRVKAAASVYGAVKMSEPLDGIPGSEQVRFEPADREIWRGTLDAEAYAPRIQCPFLLLSATDDFYGAMDLVARVVATIPHKNRWMTFTPHFNHHVAPEQSAALPLFMDRWLKDGPAWPATPQIRLELKGTPRAVVRADRPRQVRKISIYYSTDPHPQSRFWRLTATPRLQLSEAGNGLYAFANVLYESGLSLSTPVASATAEALRKAKIEANDPPVRLIDDFQAGWEGWFVYQATPNLLLGDKTFFRKVDGPEGGKALEAHEDQGSSWKFSTRKTGDPKWRGADGAALQFSIRAAQPNRIVVVAVENEFRRPHKTRTFLAEVPVEGGGGWQVVRLPLGTFRAHEGGETLPSWRSVNLLSIQSQYSYRAGTADPREFRSVGEKWQGPPPAIARIEWTLD
jgi:dienelactone hydrolase